MSTISKERNRLFEVLVFIYVLYLLFVGIAGKNPYF